ncbi:MAG: hypothetical protein RIE32_04360 [Phycisphaerales bacterium]
MRPNRNTHPRRTGSAAIAVVIIVAAILAAAAAGAFLFLRPSVPPLPQADYAQQVREKALREAGVTEQNAARAEAALAEFYRVYESDLAALYSPGSVQEFWPVYSDFAKLDADPQARQEFDEAVAATKASRVTDSMDRLASAAGLEPRLDPSGVSGLKLRRLSFVDRLQLRDAILNDDPQAAAEAFSRAQKLANVIGKPGYSKMDLLAAGGTRSSVESVILDALTSGRIDAEMARALLDATIPHDFATLDQLLEGERAMLRMEILDRSKNSGRDDQSLAEAEAKTLESWNTPLDERLKASKTLRDWQSDDWKRSELIKERAPSYYGFLETATYADHIHPGFHLALAIETFRPEQGSLPDSLDALVPDYLKAIPDDPMTGEPWVYRVDEESPQGYTLYAVGLDAEDNGGHQPMNPEAALNAVNGPGTDFVVFLRRPR